MTRTILSYPMLRLSRLPLDSSPFLFASAANPQSGSPSEAINAAESLRSPSPSPIRPISKKPFVTFVRFDAFDRSETASRRRGRKSANSVRPSMVKHGRNLSALILFRGLGSKRKGFSRAEKKDCRGWFIYFFHWVGQEPRLNRAIKLDVSEMYSVYGERAVYTDVVAQKSSDGGRRRYPSSIRIDKTLERIMYGTKVGPERERLPVERQRVHCPGWWFSARMRLSVVWVQRRRPAATLTLNFAK